MPALSSAGTLVSAIDQCIVNAKKSQKHVSEKRKLELDFHCPGLVRRVRHSRIASNLSFEFDSASSISELRDLRQFLRQYRKPVPGNAYHYNYKELGPLLKGIVKQEPEKSDGLWERFGEWIKQFLPDIDQDQLDRLEKFVQSVSIPEWMGKVIFYLSGGIILASAIWIIFREWRYYRRDGGYDRPTRMSPGAGGIRIDRHAITLDELADLPLHRKLPALLGWFIAYLMERGELPARHSLTNRELLRELRKQGSDNSAYFSDLVGASERIVYGNADPPQEQVNRLVEVARTIAVQGKAGAS